MGFPLLGKGGAAGRSPGGLLRTVELLWRGESAHWDLAKGEKCEFETIMSELGSRIWGGGIASSRESPGPGGQPSISETGTGANLADEEGGI